MPQYLVAADVDKIQELLFRSSHLREVVGGSMLLADFCDGIHKNNEPNIIISAGGGFRLHFDTPDAAQMFLDELGQSFLMASGGSLTVAGPEAYEAGEFAAVNSRLQSMLMENKTRRSGAVAVEQAPVMAFCASCGSGLAVYHQPPAPEAEGPRPAYLCATCQKKSVTRGQERRGFLKPFWDEVEKLWEHLWDEAAPSLNYDLPEDPASVIGALDPTRYVAYILADGNGMGRLFSQQTTEQGLATLSNKLMQAMWTALAAPTADLARRLQARGRFNGWPPILPLIVGGDDLFVLVPARWALDIAQVIGETFESAMGHQASLGMAVVICQDHYPYALAHKHGDELLKTAKRLGKATGRVAAVNFDVIVGNELPYDADEHSTHRPALKQDPVDSDDDKKANKHIPHRSTLKPYWIGPQATVPDSLAAGLPLATLLELRLNLKNLPGKRRSELRQRFDPNCIMRLEDKDIPAWSQDLNQLLKRIGDQAVDDALRQLGGGDMPGGKNFWRTLHRLDDQYFAHGLADLIEVWDYSYQLDRDEQDYQAEAE